MKLTLSILFFALNALGIVPGEFQVLTRPGAEYVKRAGDNYAYIASDRLVFWNDVGMVQEVPISIPVMQSKAFVFLGDAVIVGGFQGFNSGHVSNYVTEFRLGDYANGLPTSATNVMRNYWNDTGRDVKILKTSNGGVVVASFRWAWNGQYNSAIAYRNPAGAWSYYYKAYTDFNPGIVTSINFQMQEGNDGRIYIFFIRDSSHALSLARWKETVGGLEFVDFRWDFLYDKCNYVISQFICRDGDMTPHPEVPRLQIAKDTEGKILLSYQSHDALVSNDCWRAKPVIVSVDTFPQPHDARITKLIFQPAPPSYVSLLYPTFATVPGVSYTFQGANNVTNWQNIANLDTLQVDMVATNTTMTFRAFHPDGHAQKYLFRAIAQSYKRSLLWKIEDMEERTTAYVPLMPRADALYYAVLVMNENDCSETLHLHKLANGVDTEIPIDYKILAWGDSADVPCMAIERNGQYFIKRL